jgi:hypothetical protein
MDAIWTGLAAGATSGTVLAAILGVFLARHSEKIKKEVEAQFLRLQDTYRSQRTWMEKAVSELLGPVSIQLDRTGRAFRRWEAKNLFLEVKVIREGNMAVRDLLLKSPHLIPPELLGDAGLLIEHYDRWLEEYEKVRQAATPNLDTPFVFVGPQGYPFPSQSEQRFHEVYRKYWGELYGQPAEPS